MALTTLTTVAAVRDAVRAARADGASVALVPTMGALHAGHLALVTRARAVADVVAVSLFVNPMQFGPHEDLARYPRDLAADAAMLADAGADLLFAPEATEMYPDGATQVKVTAGPVGSTLEGRSRAGHFDGVLTVVAKLLHVVAPDVAVFGEKDAQQLFLVRRMVADLDFPVRIESVPIVREADGVAMSSRNRYLDDDARRTARVLPAALEAAESAAERGVDPAIAAAQSAVAGEDDVVLDYLAVVDPRTFRPVDDGYRGRALVLVAARVAGTRLIDNRVVVL